ncbi:hypothetical protein [Pseudidiomarina terrestris]|uniref:Transglycosylase SLT domain-containing protein n=1 Tax=Pseudidiomarina terrestris TaxID=2820060 RepID=A0AAW7QUL8_9GAMM|nr:MULTISPECIES: hypothetical protein [unclassified Pseudidiomarina]MDN7123877.1 hypothetical protein [Pseudidiomarina sp. 1APP75-32.1]MDN7127631.1 hypothetical protein [Pseudidiomarina sp. 1APR75-33.1]MDN7130377.1 hypothetical protein [Pseudidiomarina sp. 1APR75-15]MDN7136300.1 hypothetical protein [Pseudidiomarina sp. 1ASP75-5]MDN7138783.1 hypothetical protein [Pseudidiomarina sp. 1ASP75-14]
MTAKVKAIVSGCLLAVLAGCASAPPEQPEDLCEIFYEKRDWYDAAADMQERWGVPIQVPMAMMYQESSFKHDAVPPRDYLLWIIPWGRVSSAYGYSQAKTPTWDDYERETGNSWASRDSFADAIDFMGWFIDKSQRINGVSKWDAYGQYLNYHEGWGGYKRQTYRSKAWLMRTAEKVKQRAGTYGAQLRSCEDDLQKGWFWRMFFS